MTRTYANRPLWVWQCDECLWEDDTTATHDRSKLPTPDEMRERGWYVANLWGDKCPRCAVRMLAGKENNDE